MKDWIFRISKESARGSLSIQRKNRLKVLRKAKNIVCEVISNGDVIKVSVTIALSDKVNLKEKERKITGLAYI